MPLLQRLLRSRPRIPPSITRYNKLATAGTKTSLIAMAAYVCTVAAQPASKEMLDKDSKAHHVKNSRGETVKFQNPYPSHVFPALSVFLPEVLKMLFGFTETPTPKLEDNLVPVVKPEFLASRTGASAETSASAEPKLRATWLGHACYYVEYPSGLRVLFDPVFEECCSPVTLSRFKRYTPPPCAPADLPFVDAVVISHSHYDHLSHPTVQEIARRHPRAHFFVGLGLESWFRDAGIRNVSEMDWWDEVEVTFSPERKEEEGEGELPSITAKISCLPCQHSSGRSGFDKDRTLWASWAVRSAGKTVWFGGDTGYRTVPKVAEHIDDWGPELKHLPVCPQFRQIGEHLGSVDLGLIPIGAYHPRHIFSHMHANPYDSVEIFRDTNCKRAMGIHWGTWVLTPEHPLEPPRLLKEALKRRGLPETGVFDVCDIGESREF